MVEKYVRIGFTEMTLLFIYYCEQFHPNFITPHIKRTKADMIRWFYTTSGYYDKSIVSSYMDASHPNNVDPDAYNTYFKSLLEIINKSTFTYGIHGQLDNTNEFSNFIRHLQPKNHENLQSIPRFFNFIRDKCVLFISPFAELFESQYLSGNCKIIHPEFETMKSACFYTNIYTFFNKGPHNNLLETAEAICHDIESKIPNNNYDSVVISAGAYSNIIANYFFKFKNKNMLSIGGELQEFFGVLNNRGKSYNPGKEFPSEWIVEIPEKFKPDGYKKIENGCYW